MTRDWRGELQVLLDRWDREDDWTPLGEEERVLHSALRLRAEEIRELLGEIA